jgi:hypothetical protein
MAKMPINNRRAEPCGKTQEINMAIAMADKL